MAQVNSIVSGSVFVAGAKIEKGQTECYIDLSLLLPDQDSNLDKLNQNQLYYHYTIGQPCQFLNWECKNRVSDDLRQMVFKKL
jgi:hypothetical protein